MIDKGYDNIALCAPERVLPNPYQPRDREDQAHVAKVAESILQEGLLQVPVGRLTQNSRVELAFGHTRLAAYRLLNQLANEAQSYGLDLTDFPGLAQLLAKRVSGRLSDEEQTHWMGLPVNIRELSNDEMFRLGVSENLARKDLTPLEEARAMARYRDEFGKTSEQIGELFGLNESTVRNKIRLLDLPENIRAALASGAMTEGAARELLPLLDMPKAFMDKANRNYPEHSRPAYIIECAMKGELATSIHDKIAMSIVQNSEKLSGAKWKYEEVLRAADTGLASDMPLCKGCLKRITRDKVDYCLDGGCFWEKNTAWQNRYLLQAAEAAGLPAVLKPESGVTTFYYARADALETAKDAKCPNLAVKYEGYSHGNDPSSLAAAGFPLTSIFCKKRSGFCICINATKAGVPQAVVQPAASQPAAVEGELPVEKAPAALTVEDLQGINREAKKQKKANHAVCMDLMSQMAGRFAEALYDKNERVWKLVLEALTGYRLKDEVVTLTDIRYEIGKALVNRIYNVEYYDEKPDVILKKYNSALMAAGLPELSVSVETVEEG